VGLWWGPNNPHRISWEIMLQYPEMGRKNPTNATFIRKKPDELIRGWKWDVEQGVGC
jgi:hypothetical protein